MIKPATEELAAMPNPSTIRLSFHSFRHPAQYADRGAWTKTNQQETTALGISDSGSNLVRADRQTGIGRRNSKMNVTIHAAVPKKGSNRAATAPSMMPSL